MDHLRATPGPRPGDPGRDRDDPRPDTEPATPAIDRPEGDSLKLAQARRLESMERERAAGEGMIGPAPSPEDDPDA